MALDQSKVKHASSFKEQFTVRAITIGVIGSIVLTCSSMFVALKASSLPWPIMFVALVSMFGLKALGHTNYNEINVTHTAMSAGATKPFPCSHAAAFAMRTSASVPRGLAPDSRYGLQRVASISRTA